MLEIIPLTIVRNLGYKNLSSMRVIRQDNDFFVTWEIDENEALTFTMYKDGTWEVEDLEYYETIEEGKTTSPLNKSWISRLVKMGYSESLAYNSWMEWKKLTK